LHCFKFRLSFIVVTFPFAKGFENLNGKINGITNGKINSILGILKGNPLEAITDFTEVFGKPKGNLKCLAF